VLTAQGAARWIEALTGRGAYDNGPTWLLFENWQVTNAEEAYWALNCMEAVTNNHVVYSFTNGSPGLVAQDPMYSVMALGVTVPLFRVLPGASSVEVSGPAGTDTAISWDQLAVQSFSLRSGPVIGATETLVGAGVSLTENVDLGDNGASWLNLTAVASAGSRVDSLTLALGPPPPLDPDFRAPPATLIQPTSGGFVWSVAPSLGQSPDTTNLTTVGTFRPAPGSFSPSGENPLVPLAVNFVNSGPGALNVHLGLETDGTSNPATVLPPVMTTPGLLQSFDIHFLLLPNTPLYSQTVAFYQFALGFRVVYVNPEWQLLNG
jgi:hypothetical protein